MGYGVEVKINDVFVVDAQAVRMADESFLKTVDVRLIQRIGVGGERCTFWKHVQSGKQPKPWVKRMPTYMGISLSAEQFECQYGKEIIHRWYRPTLRQFGFPDHAANIQLGQEGGKQEHTCPVRFIACAIYRRHTNGLRPIRNLSTLYGTPDPQLRSAGELWKTFLGKHPLNGTDGKLDTRLHKHFSDFPCG
jgi:hypothetical protein